MATITLVLEDVGEDITMKISSTEPELPNRQGIKSTDPDLTPAQATIFEMLELYIKARNIEDATIEATDATIEATDATIDGAPKKGCCGGKCKRPDK